MIGSTIVVVKIGSKIGSIGSTMRSPSILFPVRQPPATFSSVSSLISSASLGFTRLFSSLDIVSSSEMRVVMRAHARRSFDRRHLPRIRRLVDHLDRDEVGATVHVAAADLTAAGHALERLV